MYVEGAEDAVLKGMETVFREHRRTLLVELHGAGELGEKHPAWQRMASLGYRLRWIDPPDHAQAHVLAEHPGG